ncbi:MAG: HDIG domain-containing protein [Bacteroidia bacterium]|nr:HDIG domain-containing protein [Bacteroidia bacterium]
MRKFLIYISNSHEAILKGIIILITVGVIAMLLPHKVRYKFDFQRGKAWNNNDLTAPFDFAVKKDPDSLKAERQEILKSVLPHFQMDTLVLFNAVKDLSAKVSEQVTDTFQRSKYLTAGKTILEELYSRGIIRITTNEQPGENGRLTLVIGKFSVTKTTGDFYEPRAAAAYLETRAASFTNMDPDVLVKVLNNAVTANVFYDKVLTEKVKAEKVNEIFPTRGMVQKGELIISRGELVSAEKFMILESLKSATESEIPDLKTTREIFIGQLLIIAIGLTVLLLFLAVLRKDIFADNRKVMLIFVLMMLMIGAYTAIMKFSTLSTYVVPLCVLPIVIRVFFDTRLALFTHVITVLILGSVAPNGYEFVFMQTIAGMVTIFSVTHLRKRAQLFISAGMIFISYMICYVALSVIHEGSLNQVNVTNMTWLVGNVLLTLFAYPLIYIFEKLFGLTSDITLMELADTNSALLRELSIKAPGTFQHSMQVANLAEAAAFKIGGNTLLIRVGALYHDIGKMEMPMYFIENQSTGVNPHDELSFEESASIIISHVIRGIEKARKNKLPDLIIDFIRTHHGTSMVQYFYQSFLKNYPEQIVDEDDFRYPGPLPFSKETAVLMMADSVEASSRSLAKPDADSINKLVDSVIDRQIEQQQFVNCDITFKDISSIKKIFKKMLMSIYHVRVEYPKSGN